MWISILLLVVGLFLLVKGADWMVAGASSLAKKYKVSDLAIGLTVVAFGTSAPELVVNVFGAYNGYEDIVFGNVIGSNNFNLFIILGIAGLIMPISVKSSTVWKEIPLSLLAVLLLLFLANNLFFTQGTGLSRIDGIILLIFFLFFIYYVYSQLKTDEISVEQPGKVISGIRIWVYILIGLGGLVFGGKLVVDHAVQLATMLGVSDKIIGLTIVAAGTSLPELATSLVAAIRKNNDIAVGNIVGSNIFNIFLILGVSSLIRPLDYNPVFNRDLLVLGGGTIFLFFSMFSGGRKKLDRWEAGLLLLVYVFYMTLLILKDA